MTTPFDEVIESVIREGYHNHRKTTHSKIVSEGVLTDIVNASDKLRDHLDTGEVKVEHDIEVGRREADLVICEVDRYGHVDPEKVRVAMENKSVVTAHRNKNERRRDMNAFKDAVQSVRKHVVTLGTIMIGTSPFVMNIPDGVKKMFRGASRHVFQSEIVPRLSSGDASLWDEFHLAISENRESDPRTTVEYFRNKLPIRDHRYTHEDGFDYLILAPVFIDNVNPPYVDRTNQLGLAVDRNYSEMINVAVTSYESRF